MSRQYERLSACYEYYKSVTDFQPKVGLILGSGLGNYARNMKVECEIPYQDIPNFPVSTVQGHDGRFLLGYIGDIPAVVMKGRVHYYEGYSMEEVVLPTRLMKMMGTEILFLTNASGGINADFQAGDFMMITDQISNFVPSPLIGQNVDELGERFTDMTHIYDQELQQLIRDTAQEEGIAIQEGVYLQTTGPNFESPAEIRMFATLGADAVGMSTACEALTARHAGMRVCGISVVSNMASGISKNLLSHQEVQETANRRAEIFEHLVTSIVLSLKSKLNGWS
ncbi:MAG: purine-nucleoside phosphorylase [Hespellia sp.]|nr:purine-nucleoside phosphorylase [Hespellia sp.]